MKKTSLKAASLFCLLIGAISTHIYLLSIRLDQPIAIFVLLFGVAAQSAGILLAIELIFRKLISERFFFFCVLILSLSVIFMQVTRFAVPFYSDTTLEYANALTVSQATVWDPSNTFLPYNSYLSTTIFPTVLSQVLGLSVFSIFSWIFPIIISFLPLIFAAAIIKYFGASHISYLSVGLIPMFFFFQEYIQNLRSTIAIIFLFLVILTLAMSSKKSIILTALFGLGLAFSHFTVGYFSIVILTTFLLSPLISKIFKTQSIHLGKKAITKVSIILIELFVWSIYIGVHVTGWNLTEFSNFLGTWVSGSAGLSSWGAWAGGSPRGPIVTGWFDLQFILIGLGALLLLYTCCSHSKKGVPSWALAACVSITLIIAVMYLPGFGRLLGLERLMLYTLPFLIISLTSVLLLIRQRIKIVFFIFIFMMLSMNMMLPSHEIDVLYHPVGSLSLERQAATARITDSDIMASLSISNYMPATDQLIGADSLSYTSMLLNNYALSESYFNLVSPNGTLNGRATYYQFNQILLDSGVFVASLYDEGSIKSYRVSVNADWFETNAVNFVYTTGSMNLAQNLKTND
ncbi:MAG: hypothetical protein NWE93_06040 [Candidatus Bathyarchaeota archaeon]|nr:hypothetical protein [Candidatus Bathyarchaeota archaeon]